METNRGGSKNWQKKLLAEFKLEFPSPKKAVPF